ncbi:hypothetical protein [Shewanella waksmanii]|uniref:hypothetical protein n=1 Tax=Shewanella waksmanii TaxID=213783 RepID=UPI00048AD72A|nr:hypothetical protein [Shewanella waksmanii]
MINSTVKKVALVSLTLTGLLASSFSAQANESLVSEMTAGLESNLASQMQEVMNVAQRELSLSIQAQLSETLFETQDVDVAATQDNQEEVITSAMIKE